jgi:hypothetical protein
VTQSQLFLNMTNRDHNLSEILYLYQRAGVPDRHSEDKKSQQRMMFKYKTDELMRKEKLELLGLADKNDTEWDFCQTKVRWIINNDYKIKKEKS